MKNGLWVYRLIQLLKRADGHSIMLDGTGVSTHRDGADLVVRIRLSPKDEKYLANARDEE